MGERHPKERVPPERERPPRERETPKMLAFRNFQLLAFGGMMAQVFDLPLDPEP